MAEKKKKSPPKFGGKRALKDTSGDGKITFADTFLGDLLGFDGKAGTKGKAGLRKSLGGARRMKDGVEISKRPKARPKVVKKKAVVKKVAVKGPVRRGDGTGAGVKTAARKRLDDKNGMPVGIGGLNNRIDEPGAPFFNRGGPKKPTPSSMEDVKKGQAKLRDRGEPKQLTLSQRNLRKFKKDPSSLNKIEKDRLFKSLKRQGVTIPKGLTGNNR